MPFANGVDSITLEEVTSVIPEPIIALHYLALEKIPTGIRSPLRKDEFPSMGIFSPEPNVVRYIDFSTGEKGSIIDLLSRMWNMSFKETLRRIYNELKDYNNLSEEENREIKRYTRLAQTRVASRNDSKLFCKVRNWEDYDIEYWNSYGVDLCWLKLAEVYPISHKIIEKNNNTFVFKADKYAYAFVERKEGKVTLKIYQPFNRRGFKWSNKHDKSVISLWTKIPEFGDKLCICSSLKDALCLWANTGIPSIALQGEGYVISNTAILELKRRYKQIYICFDNDKPGFKDAIVLSEKTGFTNVVIPYFEGGKDISDLMKVKGKKEFLDIMCPLFK
jgi:hypothetical protein